MHDIPHAGFHRAAIHLPATAVSAVSLLAMGITGCAAPQAASPADTISSAYSAAALTISVAPCNPDCTATFGSWSTATDLPSTPSPSPAFIPTSGVAYVYSSGCNNAAYLSDVTVPDGEDIAPGENFTKTWRLLNTGNCSWSRSYSVVFVDGTDMHATSSDLDATVAIGASGDVSVDLTAPDDEGTYTAYWRLADASGTLFGEQFYVQIVVSGDAATVAPTPTTPTVTPSATSTPTPTLEITPGTLESTATSACTSTPAAGGLSASPTETPHDRKTRT